MLKYFQPINKCCVLWQDCCTDPTSSALLEVSTQQEGEPNMVSWLIVRALSENNTCLAWYQSRQTRSRYVYKCAKGDPLFLIFDEWNIKFIQSETLQGFSRLYEACMNTWVAVVDINQGPLSFCPLSTHLHSLVCVQILLILLLWSLLELTLRDHTEHRNGNICFLFTWAAENGCFLCTWAPAAFDKADTWVSWTIQLQNHYIIIAEKYDLRVNTKSIPYYAM